MLAGLMGIVILTTEGMKALFKGKVPDEQVTKFIVPFMVFGMATLLYVGFSYLTPPVVLQTAVIEGLKLGLMSSGLYSIGKAVIEQQSPTP